MGPGGAEFAGLLGNEVGVVADEIGEHWGGDRVDQVVECGDAGGAVYAVSEQSLPERFRADRLSRGRAGEDPFVRIDVVRCVFGEESGERLDDVDGLAAELELGAARSGVDVAVLESDDAARGLRVEGDEQPGDPVEGGGSSRR